MAHAIHSSSCHRGLVLGLRPRCPWQGLSSTSSRGRALRAVGEGAEGKRRAGSVVYKNQGTTETPKFPLTVPFLPFTAEEVLTPGAVKTLHLYEARYLALLEEVLASEHQLFAHVVVEQPMRPKGSAAARYPGAFVGENFVLLMASLVKVVDVRAVEIGAVLRVQAEGRVAVREVFQAQPFIKGQVEQMLDEPLQPEEMLRCRQLVEELEGVMRDVQNLAMKFKAKETSNLQQAMYWANQKKPLLPGIQQQQQQQGADSPSTSSSGSSAVAAEVQPTEAAGAASSSPSSPSFSSSSSCRDPCASSASSSSSGASSNGGIGNSAGVDQEGDSWAKELSMLSSEGLRELSQRACRLSFAALQIVPESTEKEQMQLARKKITAMEISSTLERLELTLQVMTQARALLAAKCALKSLNIGAS